MEGFTEKVVFELHLKIKGRSLVMREDGKVNPSRGISLNRVREI